MEIDTEMKGQGIATPQSSDGMTQD